MANQDQLNILLSGKEKWKYWRRSNLETIPKLDESDLSGMDLSGLYFERANMYRANLSGANLSGAIFFKN
jgi:uncharacterized protein YjbI with pentapeptide repeats